MTSAALAGDGSVDRRRLRTERGRQLVVDALLAYYDEDESRLKLIESADGVAFAAPADVDNDGLAHMLLANGRVDVPSRFAPEAWKASTASSAST